jgi:hypothetical protein
MFSRLFENDVHYKVINNYAHNFELLIFDDELQFLIKPHQHIHQCMYLDEEKVSLQ